MNFIAVLRRIPGSRKQNIWEFDQMDIWELPNLLPCERLQQHQIVLKCLKNFSQLSTMSYLPSTVKERN
jgi:hypothetical protein